MPTMRQVIVIFDKELLHEEQHPLAFGRRSGKIFFALCNFLKKSRDILGEYDAFKNCYSWEKMHLFAQSSSPF